MTTGPADLFDQKLSDFLCQFRQLLGMKPSKDPKADELRNSNISQSDAEIAERNKTITAGKEAVERSMANQNGEV